jgi:hypothetical protein
MYAVDSRPALREIPGIAKPMHLKDILAALRQLDGADDRARGNGPVAQARRFDGNSLPSIAIPKYRMEQRRECAALSQVARHAAY